MVWVRRLLKTYMVVIVLVIVFCLAMAFIPGLNPFNPEAGKGNNPDRGTPNAVQNTMNTTNNMAANLQAEDKKAQGNMDKDEANTGISAENSPDDFFLTSGEITAMENISLLDKITGLAILSKLNRQDIDKIYDMTQDGLTYGEMEEVKSILEKYISQNDIQKLNELLIKNKELYAQGKLAAK